MKKIIFTLTLILVGITSKAQFMSAGYLTDGSNTYMYGQIFAKNIFVEGALNAIQSSTEPALIPMLSGDTKATALVGYKYDHRYGSVETGMGVHVDVSINPSFREPVPAFRSSVNYNLFTVGKKHFNGVYNSNSNMKLRVQLVVSTIQLGRENQTMVGLVTKLGKTSKTRRGVCANY